MVAAMCRPCLCGAWFFEDAEHTNFTRSATFGLHIFLYLPPISLTLPC